ncbi:MAG: hypothetical protein CMM87_03490 [Rickettsiales bacterium]|nr:hypothetical protein [Rickettsiales bacterium]|tara:strand:- start:10944 stop:12218 length:1275 start_codon:yes stop_codon:yes gene_type:complete
MTICRTFRAVISSLSSKGFGIFSYIEESKKSCEAEVFNALPGEKVLIEKCVTKNKKNFQIVELLKASQGRQESPCSYFGSCGGCQTLHMSDQLQKGFKRQKIVNYLKDENLECPEVRPVEIYGRQTRRRFRFEFIKTKNSVKIGLRKYNSHKVIDLNDCYVADQKVSNLLTPLKTFLVNLVPESFKATITVLLVENGLDISASSDSPGCFFLEQAEVKNFMGKHHIARFMFDDEEFIFESPYIILDGLKVNVPPQAFLQASKQSEKAMQEIVKSLCSEVGNIKKIVDLYCGLGTFLIPLTPYYTVHGFEVNEQAVKSLKSALGTKANNAKVYARDLVASPLKENELNEYQVAILNPPRVGVSKIQLIEISKSKIKSLVYISCNPETLARDCKMLSDGFLLKKIFPVDQFYGSYHIEVVAFLERP